MPAPIAVFAFNRLDHIRQSMSALAANDLAEKSEVLIFCDGPRTEEEKLLTDAVRKYCRSVRGFKNLTVIERDKNFGCDPSVSSGLMEFFATYPEGIVIEDDIVLAPNALRWFNLCLDRYRDEPAVFSVSGWSYPEKHMRFPTDYAYDAYFLPRFHSWGWASWAKRIHSIDWRLQDYETFIASARLTAAFNRSGKDLLHILKVGQAKEVCFWDILAAYSAFKHGQLVLVPRFPYVTNIGTVGGGTHVCNDAPPHPTLDIDLSLAPDNPRLPGHVVEYPDIVERYRKALERSADFTPVERFCRRIKRSLIKRKLWPSGMA